MKKRLTLFVMAIVFFTGSVVFADYYPDNAERADISFSEMTEYELDLSQLASNLEDAGRLFEDGEKPEKILAAMDKDIPEDSIDFVTKINIDYIRSSLDNSAENNAEYIRNSDLAVDIQQALFDIIEQMYNHEDKQYRQAVLEYTEMSEEEAVRLIESFPTDAEFALEKQLNALMERYYNNQFGMYELERDGQKYSFDDILSAPDRFGLRDMMDYFKGSRDILAPLFIEMVEVRQKLAKEAGFESYVDYAYSEVYPKDYTDTDREVFYENTKNIIVPLFHTVKAVYDMMPEIKLSQLSDDEIVAAVRGGLERIHPELTEAFDYMVKYGLYDIKADSAKKDGAFTTTLEYFKTPYIFVKPTGDSYDTLGALVHEYGHFNADFHSPLFTVDDYEPELYVTNLDVSEIHSQALELLFMENYGRIYNINSPAKRLESILYMLDSVIASCVFSRWQEMVYESDNLTPDILDKFFTQCCEEYGVENDYLTLGLGCEWIMVMHNFEVPFYYISYGVSALTALEIFGEAVNDRESGIDKYMKLSAFGSSRKLKSVLEDSGCSDIFTEESFLDVYNAVMDYTGLIYDDVSLDDWYFPYVIYTAYYTDPLKEKEFSPDSNATRLMFVEALGRMQEDTSGLLDTEDEFSDIDSKYVAWAASEDIVEGIGDNLFGPGQPVTREQIVCFLYRMAGSPSVSGSVKFTDATDVSSWAKDAVIWSQEVGVSDGYTDGSFRPKKNVTRGEAVKFLTDAYISYYGTEVTEDDN